MCDVARRETYLVEEHVKGHQDSERSCCQPSKSKAQTLAAECGTVLLDHNQAEKKCQAHNIAQNGRLNFVVILAKKILLNS